MESNAEPSRTQVNTHTHTLHNSICLDFNFMWQPRVFQYLAVVGVNDDKCVRVSTCNLHVYYRDAHD